jgi:RNA polymerase sigma factor (sigma-70 family)
MDPPSFAELVSRARCGDPDAIRRLVELYEPVIRRQVRFSLLENRLRRVLEETDVCQSVMGRFFAGLEQRRFEFDGPEQLNGLLRRLVRNKITDQARYWKAGRRDYLRNIIPIDPDDPVEPMCSGPTPSRVVADADFLASFECRLSDEERAIFALRRQGMNWPEIADRIGGKSEAIRKRFERALERVRRDLDPEA